MPDLTVTVTDADGKPETVTMREMRFGEQARHGAALARLATVFSANSGMKPEEAENLLLDAMAEVIEPLSVLVALCCGKTPEWYMNLPGMEGEAVTLAWWGANHGFFLRRLMRPVAVAMRQRGAQSSPPLSETGTTPES